MAIAKAHIPEQVEGEQNDVEYYVDFPSQGEAHKLFMLAKSRIKDIGNWGALTGPASSNFAITDTAGNPAFKTAEKGDILYIDMPGPGSIAGSGVDWVRIEAMEEFEDALGESEYIVLTVRPIANPKKTDALTAHFFSHKSTNTFIVERTGNRVVASVHGRNEMPNTDGNLIDKARNIIVGLAGRHGLSGPHWQIFVENLLKAE
ncbi:hypothetical protein DJ568_02735 [Mucilaginibacter hurinus]|uniref:Uncharacterized protein n=1 Tax=Mucilaginibacter hurinus TaxID=2201324 RepID=A0A367GU16_9SPHI|nr:hypothetical protein [Mucilaginibacter hurinus]RCH56790.1 hypothetical protein DJ568_02735 [Mucilaginibacter hurinus]